ncbi:lipopolysaccharide kinase InaA family protein [Halarsenatibacter silvermanii]|uniref:Lipopolysaccharide kinase (Kdo/WaaP) family protein n=1 Tax=Halarsenatibacter silvermanii TaxID=321763 RepID=A0A1G9I048_9FIRM|nr:lipopolysaccharide kinase InaA family protein [Halarsenatibacter silvermanii]SDL18294.1 Lipopolysaccharide kinase (Kdo/WaaP) family protein [Halarsenatibacter silvermanii]
MKNNEFAKKEISPGLKLYYPVSNENINNKILEIAVDMLASKKGSKEAELINRQGSKNVEVYKACLSNQDYYLKKYDYQRPSYILKEKFFSIEAIKQLKLSYELNKLNIPSIRPEFAITGKNNLLSNVPSIFVSKGIESGFDCSYLIKRKEIQHDMQKEKLESLFTQVVYLIVKLANNNFLHKDPAPGNFLIQKPHEKPRVFLVDFDDIFKLPVMPERLKVHMLARLKAKFMNRFEKYNFTYESLWKKSFKNVFRGHYNKKWNIKKYNRVLKELTNKKVNWRKYRDSNKGSDD